MLFADKTELLAQINSVIQKNETDNSLSQIDCIVSHASMDNAREIIGKQYNSYINNADVLKKLEQRTQALEEQCDHLLYFIHFLFNQFGELTKDRCVQDNQATNPSIQGQSTDPPPAREKEKKESPCVTKREMDVCRLLAKGFCAKEIARILFISETTVVTHKRNLKVKFNAKNTVELISKASTLFIESLH